ncbi:type IV secretion system protein [Stenotrophomonas sp. C3(2023)]|uniref:type IV secretion system protein n=1 Tax=Stenotrophomonas sp. C3(2023) TaxID=3080277 RepID=UPI00293C74F8|nr:type IV secretion system protein [Stenotrophomonas sp. C3(2023)]MDV3470246.1 type IV secretion system protein [Stenotrophomonas sp. C3(2023)]
MKLSSARIAMVLLLLLALVPAAHANGLMLNDLLTGFSAKRNGWLTGMRDFSAWLFYFMAVTGAVWTFGMLLLRGPDFSEFFVTFMRFCIMVALFGWLLDVVPGDFTPATGSDAGSGLAMGLDSAMQTLSRKMTGEAPSPDGMLRSGWQMLDAVIKASDGDAVTDKQYGMLSNMAIVAMIALALAAVNIVLLSVTLWILAYAGIFLLGFAGARWSSDIAIGYFKTVLAVVVSLLALRLVAVVAAAQIDLLFASQVNGRLTLQGVAMMMVLSVAVAVIMTRLPGLLSSAILGASVARGGAYSVSVQALATAGSAVSSSSQSMREDARQAYERLARTSAGTTESNSRLYDTAVPSPVMPTYANVAAPYGNYASLQFRSGNGFEPGTGGGAAPSHSSPAVVVSPQSSPESSDWTRSTWASRQRDAGQDAVFDTSVEQRRHRAGTPVASVGGVQDAAPMWQEPARQERRQAANTAAAAGSGAASAALGTAATRVDGTPPPSPLRDGMRDGTSSLRSTQAARDDQRQPMDTTTMRRHATTMDDALLHQPGARRSERSDIGRDLSSPSQGTAETRLRQPDGALQAVRPSEEQGRSRTDETRFRQQYAPGGGQPSAPETARVSGQMPHRQEEALRGERGERGMAGTQQNGSSLRERDGTAAVPVGKRDDVVIGRHPVGERGDESARLVGSRTGSAATPSPSGRESGAPADAAPSLRPGVAPARSSKPAPSGVEPGGSAARGEDVPALSRGQSAGKTGVADVARARHGDTPAPGERSGDRGSTPSPGDSRTGAARDGSTAPRAGGGAVPPAEHQAEGTAPVGSTDRQTVSRSATGDTSTKDPHGTASPGRTADGRPLAGGERTANERGRETIVGTRDVPAQRGSGAALPDARRRPGRLLGDVLSEEEAADRRERETRRNGMSSAGGRNQEPVDDEDEIARFRDGDGGNGGEEGAP